MKRGLIAAVLLAVVTCGIYALRQASAHNPDPNDPLQAASPVLKVADVAKAMTYYKDVLGFQEEFKAGEPLTYGGVARGKVVFHLSQHDGAIEKGAVYVYVKGVDTLHEEFKKKGAQITEGPIDRPYAMREFVVKTPDGHVLTFAEGIEKK